MMGCRKWVVVGYDRSWKVQGMMGGGKSVLVGYDRNWKVDGRL